MIKLKIFAKKEKLERKKNEGKFSKKFLYSEF